jgi:hypothetical protein
MRGTYTSSQQNRTVLYVFVVISRSRVFLFSRFFLFQRAKRSPLTRLREGGTIEQSALHQSFRTEAHSGSGRREAVRVLICKQDDVLLAFI